jgi:hypothetical protein
MVAWGRIELPTRGFSKHVFVKSSMFMGLTSDFRATLHRPCYNEITEFVTRFHCISF